MKRHNESVQGSEGLGSMEDETKHDELSEHELDMHHKTLLDAEALRGNKGIMDQLKPHMEKKMTHMKKILSLTDLKKVAKQKQSEVDSD